MSQLPSVIRSQVAVQANYTGYREILRFDFWYSCAYCSCAETEAIGFGFQIDHFEPQANDGADVHSYTNLMWACAPCNLKKSNIWPSTELQSRGYRFLRPDLDSFEEHLELVDVRLTGKTKAGEYTIETLYLNRQALRQIRAARQELARSAQAIAQGLQALLSHRLETLKPDLRARFARARDLAQKQHAGLKDTVSPAAVRVLNHSPLLDPDPEARASTARRRAYLKGLNAPVVESGVAESDL